MKLLSEISLWWLLPALLFSVAVSWYYYFKGKGSTFSPLVMKTLFALRSTGIFIICLLLIGLIFQRKRYRTEKPILFIAADNSASMLNYADSVFIKNELNQKLKELSDRLSDKFEIKRLSFSDKVTDSLQNSFSGTSTDLSLPFRHIRELYINKNPGAILLVTDGNFNRGINPVFEAQRLKFTPVFAIGAGDTITKKDAAIHSIIANQIAFRGNLFPVKIEGNATRLKGKELKVSLFLGEKNVAEKKILVSDQIFSFSEEFMIEANQPGIQSLRALVSVDEKEFTRKNNEKIHYIEILESKRKVTILYGGIHPDLGALQSVLRKDQNTDLNLLDARKVNEVPKCDLIIFHNPTANLSLWNKVRTSSTPYLAMLTASSDLRPLSLSVGGVAPGKADFVTTHKNPDFTTILFSEKLSSRLENFPPLTVPYAQSISDKGNTLFYQRIGTVTTNKPLLTFFENGNKKSAVLYGEGIWRWKLFEYNRFKDNTTFEEIWGKTLQYLTVKSNRDKLRIFPPSNSSDREELVFRAEFYNDAFQRITEPEIQLTLMDIDDTKIANYTFGTRLEDYALLLGKLKAGAYKWKASTQFEGKSYTKLGDLIISESSSESLNLTANFTLLKDISEQTKGTFVPADQLETVESLLREREDIASRKFEETAFTNSIDLKWLFFLLIALFATEWFIRRWNGSY